MNREIKFRARRTDDGEWIYGSLVTRNCDGFPRTYIYDGHWDEVEIDEYDTTESSTVSLKECFISVDPETVGQFTGWVLKKKDAYVGDIIGRTGFFHRVIAEDQYSIYTYALNNPSQKHRISEISFDEYDEVIGNIHSNPELLKQAE